MAYFHARGRLIICAEQKPAYVFQYLAVTVFQHLNSTLKPLTNQCLQGSRGKRVVKMKNHQTRDLIQSPLKDSNSIYFNAMEIDFNYETILLSFDIIFLAVPALTQEMSVAVLQQQRRKNS